MRNPIVAALDVPTAEKALRLAEQLVSVVGAFKIGSELFTSLGPDIVRQIRQMGAPVFLDLKYHDIPNTVAGAVAAATRLQVSMLTVHTSGGLEMMQAAEEAAQETARQLDIPVPLVLGVTVLTSLTGETLSSVGQGESLEEQVQRLAELAVKAGLRGLVCSPLELALLRRILPGHIQLVTPGIRSPSDTPDDQRRTMAPQEALAAGANWVVIGRPICAAENPREAAEAILGALTPA